ncbi:MAG: hypothetical protein AAF221_11645 [Pseudomonadota bacterium]
MRSFLATIVGILAAAGVVFVMESLGHMLFPPSEELDLPNAQAMAAYVSKQPLPAKLWLVLSWSMGATSGCFVASRIVKESALPAVLVGAFMGLGVFSNAYAIPHPIWLIALGSLAVLMGALTGYRLALGSPAPNGGGKA